jgi:hypothetical protein
MVNSKDGTNLQRGALLTLYNLSACETSHPLFVENNVTPSIVTIINGSPDLLCRRFALMILANVACNDKTRAAAVKGAVYKLQYYHSKMTICLLGDSRALFWQI